MRLRSWAFVAVLTAVLIVSGVAASGAVAKAGETQGQRIVDLAASQAGRPYCFDGGDWYGPSQGDCEAGTKGFDCTGLTMYAVYQATGVKLSHDGRQATEGNPEIIQSESNLQPGDVVFFGGTLNNFKHAGIYAGGGKMWDAQNYGVPVQQHGLYSNFVGAARYWSGSAGDGPGYLGASLGDGTLVAKQGLTGSCVTETGGLSKIRVADAPGGPLLGGIQGNGTFIAKQGLGGSWVTETTNAKQIAMAGPYIGVLLKDGTFLAKQGLTGTWVTETGGMSKIAVADTSGGPLLGGIQSDGTFIAKQGLGGSWVTETTNAKQIAMAGSYLGALLKDGTFVAKGGLGGSWVTETGGLSRIAIADAPSGGPLLGGIQGNGSFIAKQGLGGSWVTETTNVKQIAMAGPYIGARLSDGTFVAKGGLRGSWVTETSGVTGVAVGD